MRCRQTSQSIASRPETKRRQSNFPGWVFNKKTQLKSTESSKNMKLMKNLMTAAIALAGVVSAQAAPYTEGDLILGIYSTSASQTLAFEINLGPASDYFNGLQNGTIANIKDELDATFGANWFTDATFVWGAAALIEDGAVTGQYQLALGVPGNISLPQLNSPDLVRNKVIYYGDAYSTGPVTTVGDGVTLDKTASTSIRSYGNTTNDFSTGKNIVNSMNSGASAHVLDLYKYIDSNAGIQGGTFTIESDGDLVYQAVPEPSAYAMTAAGGLGLLHLLRRRSIKA